MKTIVNWLTEDVVLKPAVVGFVQRDGEVLLGLRKKVSLGLGQNLIGGIGGKIGDDPAYADETVEQALVREFGEEINIRPLALEYRGRVRFIFPAKPKWNQDVAIYTIDDWENEPSETDVIKPLWFAQNKLPLEEMWVDNRYWVPQVLAGETINAVFLYGEDNKPAEYTFNPPV